MEIGDVVISDGRKGVVVRTFNVGASGDVPYVTVWLGSCMLTAPADSVQLTEEKCPQIKGVLSILGLI